MIFYVQDSKFQTTDTIVDTRVDDGVVRKTIVEVMLNEHSKSGALNLLDAPFARVKSENNYFNQDRLDMVISSHKLPVERFPDNFESSPGNCWYSSIAEVINKEVEDGRMSLLPSSRLKQKNLLLMKMSEQQ